MSRRLAALLALALALSGCGVTDHSSGPGPSSVRVQTSGDIPTYLQQRARPIGKGPRFHPALRGEPTGACLPRFKPRFEAHIEVFAANKVLLLPGAIGTRAPRRSVDGQLTGAGCFGNVVTLNDEGILYVRPGSGATLQTVFKAWGEALTGARIASFSGNDPVKVFVNGRRRQIDPRMLRITPHAEIVIEVGPYVPPHTRFAYPAFPQVS